MKLPLSIIIPTLNEEKFLPKLLVSIRNQTVQPKEIIVSDAYSKDNTRKIAQNFGVKVVNGGLPGVGRNNGAKIATQPNFLFLDADVVLPRHFLEKTFEEMVERELDIASCFITPRSNLKVDHILHEFANQYMKYTHKFQPQIPGFCIFVKREIHERIDGFDESIILAEDHNYVGRASKIGRFAYLNSFKIPVSVRRLSRDGRIKISLKFIGINLHLIFVGEIRRDIFRYRFGHYFK